MEKTLSPEERIRRAEEIYYRRKVTAGRNSTRVNVVDNKKDFGMLKKLILQILICIVIYVIFYMINNTNYIFSENVINKTKEILSYDINIQKLYDEGKKSFNSYIKRWIDETKSEEKNENNEEINEEEKVEDNSDKIDAIGGENIDENQNSMPLSQMEQDAKDILCSKSLIVPLKGEITSRFGIRESTNPIVTRNHTGIDIAANEGTIFIASMEGTVELVSSEGDLGNHIKITNGEVATVYAHCSKIYVKEGEKINQGQKIGEVGQTGNATGPHLHFEIKKDGRYVDPDLILHF